MTHGGDRKPGHVNLPHSWPCFQICRFLCTNLFNEHLGLLPSLSCRFKIVTLACGCVCRLNLTQRKLTDSGLNSTNVLGFVTEPNQKTKLCVCNSSDLQCKNKEQETEHQFNIYQHGQTPSSLNAHVHTAHVTKTEKFGNASCIIFI